MDTATLNELIETVKDGELGFRAAAEDATDSQLKQEFAEFAAERGRMASQLQQLVSRQGEEPDQSGSVSGAIHRGWINLKSSVVTRDNLAVLEECEKGEDFAVAAFRKALDGNKLGSAQSIVQQQASSVLAVHNRVRALRDLYRSRGQSANAAST